MSVSLSPLGLFVVNALILVLKNFLFQKLILDKEGRREKKENTGETMRHPHSPIPSLYLFFPPALSFLTSPSPLPRLSFISAPFLFLLDEAVSQIGNLKSTQDLGSQHQPSIGITVIVGQIRVQ